MKKKLDLAQRILMAAILAVSVALFAGCESPETDGAAKESVPSARNSSLSSKTDSTAAETSGVPFSQKALTYDELKEWSDNKLAEIEQDVQQGDYSQENLEKERRTYEKALSDIENGAKVYLLEQEDGAHTLNTIYPNDEVLAELDEDGTIVYKDK